MLVNLTEAKDQLQEVDTEHDAEIIVKLEESIDWAIEVIGANYDPDWTGETVPGPIKSAIKARLSAIYDDDPDGKYLDIANRLIERWRDHTLA